MIDLRSDTVTRPSPGMRRAMAEAEVGDDVFGEDPTLEFLQQTVAALLGKESALFVPSGSMANAICLKVHTQPGDEVLCDSRSHIVSYEAANLAVFSGLQARTVDTPDGLLRPELVEPRLRTRDLHSPGTTLISLENTHNVAGGTIYPLDLLVQLRSLASARGFKLHLDGARLWNAHVATGVPLARYAEQVDSVSVCFSKGLGAPVGSCIAGSHAFIEASRRVRKMLGGGMRQAGVLAAAALWALEHNLRGLAEDHRKAKFLAEQLSLLPGLRLDPASVQTNILFVELEDELPTAPDLCALLAERGVLALPLFERRLRLVTHLDVNQAQCQVAVEVFAEVLTTIRP